MNQKQAAKQQALPRLCLNMIVRNEAAIISHCLTSVAPHIDCWSILDTGSTDATPTIIQEFFAAWDIPGELHHGEFIDFSTSRNQALNLCRESELPFDYILLIDADMELQSAETGWTETLTEDAYTLQQHSGLVYDNLRLLKRTIKAEYVGVTHEYLSVNGQTARLAHITMLDHASGSNRTNKSERDIRLLREGLELEPDNLRYMFYLAQSLRDAGNFTGAISLYQKRINGGGWDEECWYSAYQKANCLLQSGDHAEGISAALSAYNQRPWRAEPLALLCGHYRAQSQYHLCCEFAAMGLRIPFPQQDKLFIEAELYQWFFRQELSIAAFYTADPANRSLGKQFCHQLSSDPQAPDYVRQTARSNLRFYAHPAREWLDLRVLENYATCDREGWTSMNPSICVAESQHTLLLRQVNYRIADRHYKVDHPDGVIRTQNLLLSLNDQYQASRIETLENLLEPQSIATGATLAKRHDFPVQGYEDGRLIRWRDHWWFSATVRDTTEHGICEIALVQLSDNGLIKREYLLRGDWSTQHQKNWMPFIYQGSLHFVYSLCPTIILRFDEASGTAKIIHESQPQLALEHLRGGAQLLCLDEDGWLGICHESINAGNAIHYLHRFFRLDEHWQLSGLTNAFKLSDQNIEFCSGLGREGTSDRLLLSYGVNDSQAQLATLSLQAVRRQLGS